MAVRPCPDLEKQPITFRIPPGALIDRAKFRRGGYLRGRVVNGKVVIENWTRRNVFQPQNVCWWEKVKKAKRAGARRTSAARRAK